MHYFLDISEQQKNASYSYHNALWELCYHMQRHNRMDKFEEWAAIRMEAASVLYFEMVDLALRYS